MLTDRVHALPCCLITLVVVAGCQSPWNKLPGFGGDTPATPPRPTYNNPLLDTRDVPTKPVTKSQQADVQMTIGRSCEKNNDLERAVQVYEDVLRLEPRHASVNHRLAVTHDKLGHFDKSGEYYKKAIARDPKNAEIYADLGYSQYLKHQWEESEATLKSCLTIAPDMSRAHNNLGLLLARRGQTDAALWEFARAGCNEAEGRANMMHAMMLDQQWPAARQQCELAMASGTASPELQKRLGEMQQRIAARCSGPAATAMTPASVNGHGIEQVQFQTPAAPAQPPAPQQAVAPAMPAMPVSTQPPGYGQPAAAPLVPQFLPESQAPAASFQHMPLRAAGEWEAAPPAATPLGYPTTDAPTAQVSNAVSPVRLPASEGRAYEASAPGTLTFRPVPVAALIGNAAAPASPAEVQMKLGAGSPELLAPESSATSLTPASEN